MARVKKGVNAHKRHKKVLKLAKGYYGARSKQYHTAKAAVAHAMKIVPTLDKDKIVVVTISGRGDKDCAAIARYRGENIYE